MRELHKIRRELAKEWESMTKEEMLRSINESASRMKVEIKKLRKEREKSKLAKPV